MAWIIGVLVWVWMSFMIWRLLRIDYGEEKVLIFTGFLGISAVTGVILGQRFLGSGWIGAVILLGITVFWQCRANKWEFWELADVLGPIALGGSGAIKITSPEGWTLIAGAILTFWVRKKYRNIKWYRSGKTGFIALFSFLWWAVTEIAVAFISPHKIYWGGLTPEQWLGVWLLTFSLVGLYLRGDRKVTEDFNKLWHRTKK